MSTIMTVTGPLSSDDLGFTLMHEHLFLDLTRDPTSGGDSILNNPDLTYRELMLYKNSGGQTVVDQTTALIRGHDHKLLPVKHAVAVRQMAERTGLNIILGAGWYREPYYEQRLDRMKTDEIAEELVKDILEGIDGTDVRAGLLGEIGSNFSWVSPVEERVFRAVARAHKATGVSIATHSVGAVGLDHLDIYEEEGVDLHRVIVGHSGGYPDREYHSEIARRGAYVSFDTLGRGIQYERDITMQNIQHMMGAGLTKNIVVSHDVCRRQYFAAYGGSGYAYVSTGLLDDLAQLGVTQEQFNQITVDNPRRALTGED